MHCLLLLPLAGVLIVGCPERGPGCVNWTTVRVLDDAGETIESFSAALTIKFQRDPPYEEFTLDCTAGDGFTSSTTSANCSDAGFQLTFRERPLEVDVEVTAGNLSGSTNSRTFPIEKQGGESCITMIAGPVTLR